MDKETNSDFTKGNSEHFVDAEVYGKKLFAKGSDIKNEEWVKCYDASGREFTLRSEHFKRVGDKTKARHSVQKGIQSGDRVFESGASRNSDKGKLQKDLFLDAKVIHEYCKFMHKNRKTDSGTIREGDNWKKGIPVPALMASMVRHVEDVKLHHQGYHDSTEETYLDSIFGAIFNLMGLAHDEINLKGNE